MKKLSIKRILLGKLYVNYFPHHPLLYMGWKTYWGGRQFYLTISKISIQLDCRANVLDDLVTGTIK